MAVNVKDNTQSNPNTDTSAPLAVDSTDSSNYTQSPNFHVFVTFRLSCFMATDCLHIDKTGRIHYIGVFQTVFLMYHCHNTKHERVPVRTANIKCQLSRYWCAGMFFKPCNQRNGNAVKTSNFAVAKFLI